jgi:hypothetical protein
MPISSDDCFMKHRGIRIYDTYWNDEMMSEFWFGLAPRLESCDEGTFDVRELPVPSDEATRVYRTLTKQRHCSETNNIRTIANAIDSGALWRLLQRSALPSGPTVIMTRLGRIISKGSISPVSTKVFDS